MILFRYFVREMIFPFLLTLGVIVLILLMDQMYKFIPFLQASGLELSYLLRMVIYTLPVSLSIATPIALMVGVYYGIHRLCQDSEMIVIRASGISMFSLIKPVLAVSFLVGLFLAVQTFYLAPWGFWSIRQIKFEIIKKQTQLRLNERTINNFFNEKMVFLQERRGNDDLLGIVIADWKEPQENPIIQAEVGKIIFDETARKVKIQLTNGRVHFPKSNNHWRVIDFESMDYELEPPDANYKAMAKKINSEGKQDVIIDFEMLMGDLYQAMNTATDPRMKLEFQEEFHYRIVSIYSCLGLALFAMPFGIFDPRNPKTSNFLNMFLFLVLAYAAFSKMRTTVAQGNAEIWALYLPMTILLIMAITNFFKINYDFSSYKEVFQALIRRKR